MAGTGSDGGDAGASGRARARLTGGAGLALFVVAVVAMMIVPLPRPLLDLLLTANLAVSVALLLVAAGAGGALELSTLPTLLVLTTLLRLSLNVSSVRLILLQADAGRVIHAFGAFVVRGDYVVGFAVFLILTLVQYLVIARGAERVAEVAARFSLDALPGQQLALDAELRAGQVDAGEARRRRAALLGEAQLYGSLDGAMRFVKGDAIAGMIILAIALVGGLLVGVMERGQSLAEAAPLYALLTIGDGLVSQLPALLVSTAAGLVVTRAASSQGATTTLGQQLGSQLLKPEALLWTAGLLAALGLVPGLPLLPFAAIAAVALVVGLWARRRATAAAVVRSVEAAPPAPSALQLVVSPSLRAAAGPRLAERLVAGARRVAAELGILVPTPTVVDGARLPPGGWELKLRGLTVGEGLIPDGQLLAEAGPAALPEGVRGEPAEHPATGALASWVAASAAPALRQASIGVLDADEQLGHALEATLHRVAPELVGLDETQRLLDRAARDYPALVREVVPKRLDAATLADVLRRLVAEGEAVGDLRDVLEAVARQREPERDPALLVERVRSQLARALTLRHARDHRVEALVLDGDAEEAVRGALRPGPSGAGPELALEPDLAEALVGAIRQALEENPRAVLLAPDDLRRHVRRLVEADLPRLPVLAFHELLPDVDVERVATLRI